MDRETRKQLTRRLNRIAGQVQGIQRMVEEDRYCIDVLMQVAATRSALTSAGRVLLRRHLETCVVEAFRGDDRAERTHKIDELLDVFGRYGGK